MVDGYHVVRARTASGATTTLNLRAPKGWQVMAAPNTPDPHGGKFTLEEATKGLPKQGTLAAHIKTTLGSFYCDLYADKAPNTVANFVGLARGLRKFWDANKLEWTARNYYDGTTFHRVIPNFMIQGGGFDAGMTQKPTRPPVENEAKNGLTNDRGTLAMARTSNPHSATAQFFINHKNNEFLNYPGQDGWGYTVFGKVTQGLDVLDKIAAVPTGRHPSGHQNVPTTPVVIQSVTVK